ncbi:pseudaminic acid cytidylyltransferase [Ascidiaceihabitans sp.]|nr:pseudaminic acid cytidylyltransferase [Ascidiaceihabitans sp.]
MKIAVIPARGGSKRIPRKNIKSFCGKPMIAYAIEAALESGCFDQVIVSTDNEEIAEVSLAHRAAVPFMRPEALSDDYTGTTPVIAHATEWLNKAGTPPDYVCCIYATAPFVRPEDIQLGLSRLEAAGCDYAFSVTSFAFPIQRAVRIIAENRVEMFNPSAFQTRSQDLAEAFHDAGQFYWGTANAWLEAKPIFGAGAVPVVLPRYRVQDIDTPEDWVTAELMYKAMGAR